MNQRQIISILFADVKGYSGVDNDALFAKLKAHNVDFQRRFLNDSNHFLCNTWGDAFFICSYDPLDLADIALNLRDYYRNSNWQRMGFQDQLSIRIGLHTDTVVVIIEDGIPKDLVGINVNAAARIEPVVEKNEAYCSDTFFKHLSNDPNSNFEGIHLGHLELAKQFGTMDMYKLVRNYESVESQSFQPSPTIKLPDTDSLVLLSIDEKLQILPSQKIQFGDLLKLELAPDGPNGVAFLTDLKNRWIRDNISVAFGTSALIGHVKSVTQTVMAGKGIWEVEIEPKESRYGTLNEVSTSGLSADKIAELRARRILLNEKLPAYNINDQMLDTFIKGYDNPIEVSESPFIELYAQIGNNPQQFLASARLTAVLWLHLSGTVEHILHFDLEIAGSEIKVDFKGQRANRYVGEDPFIIEVKGTCDL